MKNKLGLGPMVVMGLLLAALVGFGAHAAGLKSAPGVGAPAGIENRAPADPEIALDCTGLLAAQNLPAGNYERYGIGDTVKEDKFQSLPFAGYTLCAYPSTAGDRRNEEMDELTWASRSMRDAEIYYLFDTSTGGLVLWRIKEELPRKPEAQPSPTSTDSAAAPESLDVPAACIGFDEPIEIDGKVYEYFSVADILGGGKCGATITAGEICWECPGTPVAPASSEVPDTGEFCIDVETALKMAGQGDEADTITSGYATGECDIVLGGGGVCWHCPLVADIPVSPTPTSPLMAEEAATVTSPEWTCPDLVTPQSVGIHEFEKLSLGKLLAEGQFNRYENPRIDRIACYLNRSLDEADVLGDEIYYSFRLSTGELEKRRIHWREDLPDHLPSQLISRQAAEAMAEDEVSYSHLAIISPDSPTFLRLVRGLTAEGEIETRRAAHDHAYWLVHSKKPSSAGDRPLEIPRIDVVDAVTGEWLGFTTAH